jgi:hypothetical protein
LILFSRYRAKANILANTLYTRGQNPSLWRAAHLLIRDNGASVQQIRRAAKQSTFAGYSITQQ